MPDEPNRDDDTQAQREDRPQPEADAPETENIKDEGEPLGANLA